MAKVLIVDDSNFLAKQEKEFLSKHGHEVIAVALDGIKGFESYKEYNPDLTLLDITMPNRNGRDCLEDILAYDPEAKVLMVSAVKEANTVVACMSMGAKGFVEKPLKFADAKFCEDFIEEINDALAESKDGE